jgi:hypothetical protein
MLMHKETVSLYQMDVYQCVQEVHICRQELQEYSVSFLKTSIRARHFSMYASSSIRLWPLHLVPQEQVGNLPRNRLAYLQ